MGLNRNKEAVIKIDFPQDLDGISRIQHLDPAELSHFVTASFNGSKGMYFDAAIYRKTVHRRFYAWMRQKGFIHDNDSGMRRSPAFEA